MPRRVLTAAVAVVALLALSGCGAGQHAQTSIPYSPDLGTDASVGNMHVDNVVVLDDGNVPEVSVALINQGNSPDTLMSMAVTGADPISLQSGGVDVRPSGFVFFGPTGAQRAVLNNLKAGLGQLVTVTFLFRVAGTVNVSAIVVPPQNVFQDG